MELVFLIITDSVAKMGKLTKCLISVGVYRYVVGMGMGKSCSRSRSVEFYIRSDDDG